MTAEQKRLARNAAVRKWRAAHIEQARANDLARNVIRFARMKEANPAAYRLGCVARSAAHRARQRGGYSPEGLTEIIVRLFERADGRCAACDVTAALELDHIVALTNGGDNSEGNLQFLCADCNKSKGAADYDLWLQRRQMAA